MHLAARWVQLSSLGVSVRLPADEGLTSSYRCILNLFPPHSYTFSRTTQTSYMRPLPNPTTGGSNQGTMRRPQHYLEACMYRHPAYPTECSRLGSQQGSRPHFLEEDTEAQPS